MGGANGKSLHTSSTNIQAYDINDPRSPSLKRTPLNTPEPQDWRQKAIRARMAAKEDPRSPTNGVDRTPVPEGHHTHFTNESVTPLTLSYGDRKINPDDPRSPATCRTPLNQAQGILKYDISEVVCAPYADDTVIVSEGREAIETSKLDETIAVLSSGLINNPLAGMTIVSSTEAVPMLQQQEVLSSKEEERRESTPEVERRELAKSELDIEVPSSPLGASACTLEDPEKEKRMSSPGLPSDRKRKKANQLLGVSPLKKSFSSPCLVDENDENSLNGSPLVAPRRTTPTTPRRATPTTPTTRRGSTPPQKRTPNPGRRSSNLKNSEGIKSPRSPLSPLVPRARNAENFPPAILL